MAEKKYLDDVGTEYLVEKINDKIQPQFIGTKAEWEALSADEKAKFVFVNLTDDLTDTHGMPIGAIVPFAGATAPTGWLICDGSAVSRGTYGGLFTVIGTAYGTGDGSTTFNLPDLRETVPVGVGTRGSGAATHDIYTLGQFKDDQLQDHGHRNGGSNSSNGGAYIESSNASVGNVMSSSRVSDARVGTTTHGKQLGVNYIIKTR